MTGDRSADSSLNSNTDMVPYSASHDNTILTEDAIVFRKKEGVLILLRNTSHFTNEIFKESTDNGYEILTCDFIFCMLVVRVIIVYRASVC